METGIYDPAHYNRLPSIGEAAAAYIAVDGDTLLSTSFRDLFVSHEMDRTFGLVLLHRHFELNQDEKLVEYRGTSVPWVDNELSANIKPSNWYLSPTGKISPYEFHHTLTEDDPTLDLGNPNQQAFLVQFAKLLAQKNAENLFGLCRYPGDDFKGRIEITQGRSNINLAPEDYPKDLKDRMSNAAWFFSPPLVNFKCICPCSYSGGGHSDTHGGHRDVT